jgi:hypothetical protein
MREDLLSNKYGHRIHFWDLRARRNVQTIDLGANHQMALEVRPAHDPVREYGFLGVVIDTTNLEGSIWTWWREGGKFHIEKTATIAPEHVLRAARRSHHEIFRAGAPRLSERPQWRGGLAVIGPWAKELSALFHWAI